MSTLTIDTMSAALLAINRTWHRIRAVNWGKAIQRPVYFPDDVKILSAEETNLPLLPLRGDRETIHVVQSELPSDVRIIFSTDDSSQKLIWRLSPPVERPASAFLAAVANRLELDNGLSNSLAGRGMLKVFKSKWMDSVDETLRLGAEKLKQGQSAEASEIARGIATIDPQNSLAKSLLNASKALDVRQISLSNKSDDLNLESRALPRSDSDLTREIEQSIRVRTEKLRNQVSTAINSLRTSDDPETNLVRLKQIDSVVRAAIDIASEDRIQMQKRLEAAINQQKSTVDKRAQEKVQLAEELAQLEAQKRLADQFQLDEDRLDGLIDRVRGLMQDGRHGRDQAYGEAQNVADVAINLRPGEGTSTAARFDAESAQQLNRSYRLRARRADQFLEALHQTELAHVPFPDEPPIRFPNVEVWQALTQRRKQWATVDLRRDNPNEKRIQSALSETTEVSFTDQPLKEALDYLESLHRIEIIIDQTALSDEGISSDQNVNLVMTGITLRSCLRLMLEPMNLTYVIEDEVMKITTQSKADEKMTTRVYPVADLAIRILPMGMGAGGGGMMGGMRGGMGGGMGGGMMGGMGGMGGGMGMGGGGFGGGGFFSLPPEQISAKLHDNVTGEPLNSGTNATTNQKSNDEQ